MKIRFAVLLFCCSLFSEKLPAQQLHPTHHVPVDKGLGKEWLDKLWSDERRAYKGEELKTIGMPCGGIAAGQLYVTGDGTLANWWIANNAYNTGYGIDWLLDFNTPLGPWKVCYQTFKPTQYIDQGFEITVEDNGKKTTHRLSQDDFDDISFVGEYPIARINYHSKTNPLPLEIESTVFSPFVPLNARESATPGTILKYTLKNTSSHALNVTLTGWLQNLVCLELKDKAIGLSRNQVVKGEGTHSLVLDLIKDPSYVAPVRRSVVLEDFESGSFKTWKVEGTAFGNAPAKKDSAGDQKDNLGIEGNYLVSSYIPTKGGEAFGKLISKPFKITNDFITFMIGGGSEKNKTCMNLVVGGKIVRTVTGDNSAKLQPGDWDVREFRGKQGVIEIVDSSEKRWGHISVDQIEFSNAPAVPKFFPAGHPYFGNAALTVFSDSGFGDASYKPGAQNKADGIATAKLGDKLVGATGTTLQLQPGETREVIFTLTWYFPYRPLQYGTGGNWNRAIPTDGPAIGNMYANWYGSALDVAAWLKENYARLSKETFTFHDAYYNNSSLPYWFIQRLMMPVSTLATETCQWWANDKFWAWEGVGSCVGTCTHVWNYEHALAQLFPELERNIREKTDFSTSFREDGAIYARNGWGNILIDGHAGAILKAYREHLHSKDNLFLSRNWEKIKKATRYIISEDGNEDGLLENKQANTYDIAFYGANTYVGSLYLGALKAASRMAGIMNDTAFAKKCDSIFESGSRLSAEKLWNGEYFIQDVDLKEHPRFQYGKGCLSDQLFGQTWAGLYGLGYLYPKDKVRKTLQSIWKYNWAPQVGVQTKIHPPERTYADFDEPGLLIATWPFDQHLGEDGVRYRDEVWTGIEYQVATSMIYEGMIDEALSIVRSVHERYRPEKHNPWNEIECGDHYARALASWGVLVAMQGYHYNGPEKSLSINPVVKDAYKGFFTAAEGWGNYTRTKTANGQVDSLAVKYGKLPLKKFTISSGSRPSSITLTCKGTPVETKYTFENGLVTVDFDELVIGTGDALSVTCAY